MSCLCGGDRLVLYLTIVEGILNYSWGSDTREMKAIVFE